jgi:thiamine biosynthesis lipoprotein
MKTSVLRTFALGLAILLPFPAGCQPRGPEVLKRTQFIMGTVVEITLIAQDDQASADAIRGAFEEMRKVEKLMSRKIVGSDVWRVNQDAGKNGVVVSRDLLLVSEVALDTSRLSGGSFDITVGSLVRLWDNCWKEKRIPSRQEVAASLRCVGYRGLEINKEKKTLFLKRKGMELVLGGIAKGYAVDQAVRLLQSLGFIDLIVNAGGDLRTGGSKFGVPWMVGIQDPRDESKMTATIPVRDRAVATSGDYERYYMKDNVRYHHIIDPLTGFPARQCRSVTVLSNELIWADALATALFVMGPGKGIALVEKLPGTEALIIDGEGKVVLSSGMEEQIRFQ